MAIRRVILRVSWAGLKFSFKFSEPRIYIVTVLGLVLVRCSRGCRRYGSQCLTTMSEQTAAINLKAHLEGGTS
jgi:hypothetical protein